MTLRVPKTSRNRVVLWLWYIILDYASFPFDSIRANSWLRLPVIRIALDLLKFLGLSPHFQFARNGSESSARLEQGRAPVSIRQLRVAAWHGHGISALWERDLGERRRRHTVCRLRGRSCSGLCLRLVSRWVFAAGSPMRPALDESRGHGGGL